MQAGRKGYEGERVDAMPSFPEAGGIQYLEAEDIGLAPSLFSECLQNMEHNVIIIMRVREIRRIEEMKMQNVLREKPKWMLFILGG